MSITVPCSACGARDKGKNAWVCWAWNPERGRRVAYLQKLCVTCVSMTLVPLVVASEDAPLACPGCHSDTSTDMDPCFATYVIPGDSKRNAEFATCGACATEIRRRAVIGAELMPDRQAGVGAAAPTQAGQGVWGELGLPR